MNCIDCYRLWLQNETLDELTKQELVRIANSHDEIEDRFYKDLEFGTAGLRGKVGVGTNRMNIYTVGKSTQGLCEYLKSKYNGDISVAIAYDSRNMSKEFATVSANILSSNGIKVYIYEGIRSTPQLSFAVRKFNCNAGIVITASHNPAEYNGYKVYNETGGQILQEEAEEILKDIKLIDYSELSISNGNKNNIIFIGKEIDEEYFNCVQSLSLTNDIDNNINIVYTPLHGTGSVPVKEILKRHNFNNVSVVKEQDEPDGNFSTVKYPNPEDINAFELAIKLAKNIDADIILGTDPDCDRVGVIVKDNKSGKYEPLSGNNIGALLVNYILELKKNTNIDFSGGKIINSIVTSDFGSKIALSYGIETVKTLTGFKYIAQKIDELNTDKNKKFVFGYEESYGYLYGDYVRDKDGVVSSMLIAEMAGYYKKKDKSLLEVLNELRRKNGYYLDEIVSYNVEGQSGGNKIKKVIEYFRENKPSIIGNNHVEILYDYKLGIQYNLINGDFSKIEVPKSNVLKFVFVDKSWYVLRASGTEPKIKVYFSVNSCSMEDAEIKLREIKKDVLSIIDCIV